MNITHTGDDTLNTIGTMMMTAVMLKDDDYAADAEESARRYFESIGATDSAEHQRVQDALNCIWTVLDLHTTTK